MLLEPLAFAGLACLRWSLSVLGLLCLDLAREVLWMLTRLLLCVLLNRRVLLVMLDGLLLWVLLDRLCLGRLL